MSFFDVPTPKRLFEQIQSSLQSGTSPGVCQFILENMPRSSFHISIGASASYADGVHPSPTATIRLPSETLESMVAESTTFDHRDPAFLTKLNIEGDLAFVARLSFLLRRPDPATVARFQRAEEKARRRPITAIERIRSPSADQVLEAIREGRPIVATESLPPVALSWTFASLKEKFGTFRLRPRPGEPNAFESVGEFLDNLEASRRVYTGGCVLPPVMWRHFKFPFFKSEEFGERQLWMGSATSDDQVVTSLHRDNETGFLAQIIGRKRVILYSPDQAELLYPYRAYNTFQLCWAHPRRPDYESCPRFREARPIEVILAPGDLFINPTGWFHHVEAMDRVMSVSRFFHREGLT
jgi:hypothetical protein